MSLAEVPEFEQQTRPQSGTPLLNGKLDPPIRSHEENLAEVMAHDEVAAAMMSGEMEMYIDELGAPAYIALRSERTYELNMLKRTIGEAAFSALKNNQI